MACHRSRSLLSALFIVLGVLWLTTTTAASAADAFDPYAPRPYGHPPLAWRLVGPGGGGGFMGLACAPSKPSRMYTGVDVGGLYLSDDGGLNWRPIYEALGRLSHGAQRMWFLDVSPKDPDVFYIISNDGPFGSFDAGQTYHKIGDVPVKDRVEDIQHYLRINPANDRDVTIQYARGMHRTRDGGKTLTTLPLPPAITRLEASEVYYPPGSDYPVIFIGQDEFFRTTDDGKTWTPVAMKGWPGGRIYRHQEERRPLGIAIDPASKKPILFALCQNQPGLIFRSDDMGDSWKPVPSPMKDGKPIVDGANETSLAVHPNDPNTLGLSRHWELIYTTHDGGQTWTKAKTLKTDMGFMGAFDAENGGGPEPEPQGRLMVFAPDQSHRVYVGNGMHLYRSDDGGANFFSISTQYLGNAFDCMSGGIECTYVNFWAADPSTGYRYISDNDVGIARTGDLGHTWRVLRDVKNEPASSKHVAKKVWNSDCTAGMIADTSQKPTKLYVWFQNSAAVVTDAFGLPGHAFSNKTLKIMGGHRAGPYVSTDNGENFLPVSDYEQVPFRWSGFPGSFIMDPHSPPDRRTFWMVVAGGVYRSDDSAQNWKCLNDQIGTTLGVTFPKDQNDLEGWMKTPVRFGRVRLDPQNSKIVYLHLMQMTDAATKYPALLKSTDGGQTWAALPSPVVSCFSFEVSPLDSNRLYAADKEKGGYISEDAGKTWELRFPHDITKGAFITTILPSRRNKDLVFVAFDGQYGKNPRHGVYRSYDNGKTWLDVGEGIQHMRILFLREDDLDPRWLAVGTRGGGTFIAYDRLPVSK